MNRVSALASLTAAMSALLLAGCSHDQVTAPEETVTVETIALAVGSAKAQPVARGVAAALRTPGLRAWLLQSMQGSPWREHKLTLQEFAQTRKGREFLSVAAEGARMNEREFLALVNELPPMDVYFPFREHRLRWSGGAELLVGTTFDGDTPSLTTYASDGATRVLRFSDGTPNVPLLLLGPAERRARLSARAPRSSFAIEHPDERRVALLDENCDPTTVFIPCDPDGGGGAPPGGGGTTPGIYVTHFHGFDDDGWFGDLEMLFSSSAWFGSTPAYSGPSEAWVIPDRCDIGQAPLHQPPHKDWNGEILISPGVNSANILAQDCGSGFSPHGYYIAMWEEDGEIQTGSHHWGHRFFSTNPSNGSSAKPWGAQVGVNEQYYANSGNPGSDPFKANLMTQYR